MDPWMPYGMMAEIVSGLSTWRKRLLSQPGLNQMARKGPVPTESRNLQIKSFDADLVISDKPHKPPQFLFVDGPSLGRGGNGGDSRARNTRSALIRRRISEKRTTYRQGEESKRQELISQRQEWRGCSCRGTVRDQAQSQVTGNKPMVSQTRNSDGTAAGICRNCGGFLVSHQARGTAAPALSLSPSTSRADPFASVDPSLRPGVDGLLQFGQ
jgi:hypothetical protein